MQVREVLVCYEGVQVTIAARRRLWTELGKRMDAWRRMSDAELLSEVQKDFPIVTEATREEAYKMLVMWHTEKMI